MSDAEDYLVEVLNRRPRTKDSNISHVDEFHPEDVYLDDNGLPTDNFLESLKKDFLRHSSDELTHKIKKAIQRRSDDRTLKASIYSHVSSSDDESTPYVETIKLASPRQTRLNNSVSTSESDLSSESSFSSKPVEVSNKPVASIKPVEVVHKLGDRQVTLQRMEFNPDESQLDIETELKIKSLQLRIQGQMNTIRALESQLHESIAIIEIRNKQLSQANTKISVLEKKSLNIIKVTQRPSENYNNPSLIKLAEDLAQKYKSSLDDITSKFNEEQARRTRMQERLRSLKEYTDTLKEKNSQLTTENLQIMQELSSTKSMLAKHKKDCKEYAADAVLHKKMCETKETTLTEQALTIEKLKKANRKLTKEAIKSQAQFHELQESYSGSQKEIDKLNETIIKKLTEMDTIFSKPKTHSSYLSSTAADLRFKQQVEVPIGSQNISGIRENFKMSVSAESSKVIGHDESSLSIEDDGKSITTTSSDLSKLSMREKYANLKGLYTQVNSKKSIKS